MEDLKTQDFEWYSSPDPARKESRSSGKVLQKSKIL